MNILVIITNLTVNRDDNQYRNGNFSEDKALFAFLLAVECKAPNMFDYWAEYLELSIFYSAPEDWDEAQRYLRDKSSKEEKFLTK